MRSTFVIFHTLNPVVRDRGSVRPSRVACTGGPYLSVVGVGGFRPRLDIGPNSWPCARFAGVAVNAYLENPASLEFTPRRPSARWPDPHSGQTAGLPPPRTLGGSERQGQTARSQYAWTSRGIRCGTVSSGASTTTAVNYVGHAKVGRDCDRRRQSRPGIVLREKPETGPSSSPYVDPNLDLAILQLNCTGTQRW